MSCKDVCMTADYDVDVEFTSTAMRKARKPHQCDECGDVIAVGETYEYVSGKCEGDMYVNKSCATCAEISKTFYCGGRMLGTLWDDVGEQIFPAWNEVVAIDCLARLTTDAAIAKMRARYAKYLEDQS